MMHRLALAILYTGLALGANAAAAADFDQIEALREGTLKKLVFSAAPQTVSAVSFADAEGGQHTLADYRGKWVLVNFWATWCAPCRREMPGLDALQGEFGGDDFAVVTIATGRNDLAGINRFFDENGIKTLPILLDPRQSLARDMGVLGLPATVLLDRDGMEVARLRGDADWGSDSARAIIAALLQDGPADGS